MKRKRALLAILAGGPATSMALLLYDSMKSKDWWTGVSEILGIWVWVALIGLVVLGVKEDV